ncbi:fumarylacetoacetate hydrolase family protein [Caballeronia sordidicola]|uniref:fumarylacetoacetate hydrolase family protein n=1 Tax=Caballeronia sordidicola TaxID=196367 RepID=UPI00068E0B56|nr:fumarylacetoacetate hydrolase family protein [Caballeronia sordidicola]
MSTVLVNVSAAHCAPFPALLFDTRVLALSYWESSGLHGIRSMEAFFDEWAANAPLLKKLFDDPATVDAITNRGMPIADVRVHAPVSPGQVFCTIGNYRSQLLQAAEDAEEGANCDSASTRRQAVQAAIEDRRRSGVPYVGFKGTASVAGPYDVLEVPEHLKTLDWEVEVGAVIGRSISNVSPERAMDCIAGYCVVNDITLRDRIFRKDLPNFGTDWLQSKSTRGWLPTGPWFVPAWSICDVAALRPWLRLNGSLMQEGIVSDMLFDIGEQVAYLSRFTTLEPGDLICTGTPPGIGSHYGRYLKPGDVMEAGIEGLGMQRVTCV